MADIAWWGIGPWHHTGYGRQTREFAHRIRDLGHRVAICPMGVRGRDDQPGTCHPGAREAILRGHWDGMPLIALGMTEFSIPTAAELAKPFGKPPDLVIVMKDAWVLNPKHLAPYNVAIWTDIDCEPMGWADLGVFQASKARPIAVSKWAVRVMRDAGLGPLYVPHGIDMGEWFPAGKAAARESLGIGPETFVAGIDAANIGTVSRKAFFEQFKAFSEFHHRINRDSVLLCHTHPTHPEGIDLRALAVHLRIGSDPAEPEDAVRFPQHQNMTTAQMRAWYQSLDVLLNATYGEGYGLGIVQALACGVPVIGTRCSAITEKIPHGAGWLVDGQRWWNPHHQAEWTIPHIGQITAKLGAAAARRPVVPPEFSAGYDAGFITREYWKPALDELLAGRMNGGVIDA